MENDKVEIELLILINDDKNDDDPLTLEDDKCIKRK